MGSAVRLAALVVLLLFGSAHGYKCLGDDYSIVLYLVKPYLITSTSFAEYADPEIGGGPMMVNLHDYCGKVVKDNFGITQAEHLERVAKIYSGSSHKVYFQRLVRTVDVENNSVEAVPRVLSDGAHENLDFSETDFSPLKKKILAFSASIQCCPANRQPSKIVCIQPRYQNEGRFGKNCTGSKSIVNPLEIVREKCDDIRFKHGKTDVPLSNSGDDAKKKPKIKQVNPTVYCYSFNACYFAYGTDVMFSDVQFVPHKN
ncbi:hypothetical protein QR680_005902 [Steinernema hermaphroditum]|uniref:Uncharacterized protein n=1 Tax=Steinernema hermaphroditum TaxID=289476 RepID=A0AA39LWH6_9BILA|nr:hypothetical protein QR680_005902 [Steinernema hermaphroditum]